MDSGYKPLLALASIVSIYTLYTILLQIGGSTIGLIPQLFYAFLLGFAASLTISLIMDRGRGLVSMISKPKILVAIIVVGIVNNALNRFLLGEGTLGTNPSISSIIQRSWLIVVALLTPLVLKQKINRMQMFAILIGFIGVYIVVSGGTLLSFDYAQAPYMGFVFISAMCSAFATLAMSKYTFDIYGATVLFNLASLVFMGLLAMTTHTSLIVSFPVSAVFSVAFFGIFGFGIATNLYYHSIKMYGPQMVGNALLVIPFGTFILSAVILNTPIRIYYVLSAIFITAGIILQKYYSAVPERITSKQKLEKITIYDITGAFAKNKNPAIANQIFGGNKALAIKLDDVPDKNIDYSIFDKYGCVAFTTKSPHRNVKKYEIDFVSRLMKLKEGETALIGLGNPKKLEDAFEEFFGL